VLPLKIKYPIGTVVACMVINGEDVTNKPLPNPVTMN
jgi:hypothetical protein